MSHFKVAKATGLSGFFAGKCIENMLLEVKMCYCIKK